MSDTSTNETASQPTRRQFIKTSTAAVAGAALVGQTLSTAVYAQGSDTIKVGLVGCGGRGSGASVNALHADKGAKLIAMGDLFEDVLEPARQNIASAGDLGPDQVDVPKSRQFAGWEAYKGVIEASDVVLLATTPHFRPMHIKACLEANKHIFAEKPVGVDAKSVREVMQLSEEAKKRNVNLVSGLCYRYDQYVQDTIAQIREGAIGDTVNLQVNYLSSWLWNKPRKPHWSDMEYQIRNWLYYYWLSGDHVVEQHIHSLDKALWVMNDVPPTRVLSTGGRTQRTAPEFGNIYDHFANCFEWDMGHGKMVRCFSYCRQFNDCSVDVSDWVYGTEGTANLDQHRITGKKNWRKPPTTPVNKYDAEHKVLFGAIRSGKTINNGDYMCKSTLMAIMARESAYSGKAITWDEIMSSKQDLSPAGGWVWGPVPVAPVAVPNVYKFS